MMHEKAKRRMEATFHEWIGQYGARSLAIDEVLDRYLDAHQRATNWDADKWGLPDETVCALEPTTPPNSWASGLAHLARCAPRDPHLPGQPALWPSEPAKWDL